MGRIYGYGKVQLIDNYKTSPHKAETLALLRCADALVYKLVFRRWARIMHRASAVWYPCEALRWRSVWVSDLAMEHMVIF